MAFVMLQGDCDYIFAISISQIAAKTVVAINLVLWM